MIKVHIFHTGSVQVDDSIPHGSKNPFAVTGLFRGKDGPVGKSYDVFGDGSILLVNTPGHSHGLFTAIIKNTERYIALAGDAIYTGKSIREKLIPGFTVDKTLAHKSLTWICELSEDENCLGVFANHDPEIKEQIIEL